MFDDDGVASLPQLQHAGICCTLWPWPPCCHHLLHFLEGTNLLQAPMSTDYPQISSHDPFVSKTFNGRLDLETELVLFFAMTLPKPTTQISSSTIYRKQLARPWKTQAANSETHRLTTSRIELTFYSYHLPWIHNQWSGNADPFHHSHTREKTLTSTWLQRKFSIRKSKSHLC